LYEWSEGTNATTLPIDSSGYYKIIATNSCGIDSASTNAYVANCNISIPNIFSPNGDDVNDLFVIDGIEVYERNFIRIHNRWGKVVFEDDDYRNNWNGSTQSGEQLEAGTYFYYIRSGGGVEYSGSITLIR